MIDCIRFAGGALIEHIKYLRALVVYQLLRLVILVYQSTDWAFDNATARKARPLVNGAVLQRSHAQYPSVASRAA